MFHSQEIIENINQETLQTLEDCQSQSFIVTVIELINYSSSELQFNYDVSNEIQSSQQLDEDFENGHSINSLNTYHPRALKQKYQELLKLNENDDDDQELSSQEIETDSMNEQFDNESETNAIQSIKNYQSNIECLTNFTKKYKLIEQNSISKQCNVIN